MSLSKNPFMQAGIARRSFLRGAAGLAAATFIPGGMVGRAMAAPTKGGRLAIGAARKVAFGGMDPQRGTGDGATVICNGFQVFEALTAQNVDGTFSNHLLESVTSEDESATVWNLKLKEGMLFHNEKEVGADDVIFSLKRLLEPGTVTAGHIGPVKAYEKVDGRTVRLTLEAPRSWLPIGLGDGFSAILPVDFDPKNPIGCGPFRIKDIVLNEHITLERWDKYHGTPANLDEVVIYGMPDPSAQLNAIQSGQIDIMQDVDPSLIGETEGNDEIRLFNSPAGLFNPIGMRMDIPPFNDVRLRQAMRLVIDRQTVVDSVYNGYAQIGNDLYGRYDPDFASDLVRERDVAKAKALVEEAGANGLTVDLVMYLDVGTAQVLAENAKEIGITINVKQLDGASYYNEALFERPFFGGDPWPSGPFWLPSSLMAGPGASYNQLHFQDAEYDSLWAEANRTLDETKRHEILHSLQKLLFDRGGWLIAAYGNSLGLYNKKVAGLPETDVSGAGPARHLNTVYIAE